MLGLTRPGSRGLRFLIAGTGQQLIPRAKIVSKSPKEVLTVTEQTIAFVVLTASLMLPSCWMLSHVEHYKRKPRSQ